MTVDIGRIGQIALAVSDVDRAETFYEGALGLRKLFRFGDLAFFDCAGVRLMLEKSADATAVLTGSPIYFRCADIVLAVQALEARGVGFEAPPHLVARMDDHDLWMAFFTDPDGHTLALMMEAPAGYVPPRD